MQDKPILKDIAKGHDWIMREKIEKIIDRYSYDVVEHLRAIRHMDCYYGKSGRQICTCGLLTDLMRLDCVTAEQLYPDFLEEAGNHQRSFNLMMPA